jgi:mannose-6-phosphate isomerase-like protein (cupin superfamily)
LAVCVPEVTRAHTEQSLTSLGIFYDELIMGCARGPRILVNDNKPTFPNKTAFAFTLERNNMSIEDINKMLAPEEVRPWGSFSTLCYSKEYNIKEIIVNPGESSSLQSHNHRDEYWLVISGEGKAITNVSDTSLYVGKIIFIERGTKHRVCNTGKNILKFIEIQVGDSFDENDIIRYEDNYNRK